MMTTIIKVINIAEAEVGYLEKRSNSDLDKKESNAGTNNYTKYARDYFPTLQGQAWCAMFVVWCMIKAYGESTAKKLLCGGFSAYTPTSAQYFKNKGQYYRSSPLPGDQIFFCNTVRICHIGLVYKVSATHVYTIEGNTSSGNTVIANGGAVCKKSYPLSHSAIDGYGRPDWSLVSGSPDPIRQHGIHTTGLRVTAPLNIRKEPKTGGVTGMYGQGEIIHPTTKAFVGNDAWFQSNKGWVSGKYLTGWVQELSDEKQRWWYLAAGYAYPVSVVTEINGGLYAFDPEGWMITSDRIAENGAIVGGRGDV